MKIQLTAPLVLSLALLAGAASVEAAVVTLTGADAVGNSSFNAAGFWSNGQAPGPTNDYFTGVYGLRTPGNATSYTFLGNSLTLQVPTTTAYSIIYKGSTSPNIYTITNLVMNGGLIRSGAGSGQTCQFAGTMIISNNGGTIQADQSPFIVSANLVNAINTTGALILTNLNPGSQTYGTVTYTGTNAGFTGSLYLGANGIIIFSNNTASVPGNPSVPTPGQITTLGTGTVQDAVGVSLTNANGGITLGGNLTLQPNSLGSNTIVSESITDNGSGYTVTKRGAGTLTLSGSNNFSGGMYLWGASVGSQLNINNPYAIGTGTFTINSGNAAVMDNTSGGAITLADTNAQAWNNDFAFAGSSSLNMGAGTVSLGGGRNVTVSNNTLTVGPVTDNGSGYGLNKLGAGTLTLNGGGSYTGATTISGGTLALIGSGLSSPTINIASNATLDVSALSGGATLVSGGTLNGSGAINGSITDNSGTVINPGGSGVAGTLTVTGNLTFNGGGSVDFDLNNSTAIGGGTNDLIVVDGALNIAGSTTVVINVLGITVGTYTLIQYGSFAGSLANITLPSGFVLTNNTAVNAIQLVVTHNPVNLTWRGDGVSDTWDIETTANWIQAGASQYFNIGDFVLFDDTGSNNPVINITTAIPPSSVTVNATQTYDFTGDAITSGTLLKTNSGTLILENNNSYGGTTVIAGGVLQVGNQNGSSSGQSGTLGNGAVSNNASLIFDRSDATYIVDNAILGSGSITMNGNGTVTLNASNTYTGATTINSGILAVENASALGSAAAGTTVNNGGQLSFVAPLTNTEPLVLDGTGSGQGALYKTNGATALGGAITLGPDGAQIYVDASSTLNLTNSTGVSGANVTLTLYGSSSGTGSIAGPISLGTGALNVNGGTWAIAPSNNFSGGVQISAGDLQIRSNKALGPIPSAYSSQAVSLNGGTLEAQTNISFADGKIGFNIGGNSTLTVDSNSTLTISNQISGSSTLTKTGLGTLALTGSNSFSGNFYVDSTSASANDGITLVTSSNALANIPATPGTPTIFQGNNNSGYSILQLNGSAGSITLPQEFSMNCRNTTNANVKNIAGSNYLGGNIDINVGGNSVYFQSDAGTLVLAGTCQYVGTLANQRNFTFQGAGNILVSGPIIYATSAAAPTSVQQFGTGTLTLGANNTYEDYTTISNGTLLLTGAINTTNGLTNIAGILEGTGAINDNVFILPGAILEPGLGNGSIGTLTITSNLTLSGTASMDINKTTGASDLVTGLAGITYGGTLAVTNLAGTLSAGNTFTLFSAALSSGNFTNVVGNPGAGLGFSFNPTNGVLSVVSTIPGAPTNFSYSVSSGFITLSWPSNYIGWILQAQTNPPSVGITTNWVDVAGTASEDSLTLSISASNSVFFRMRHP
jgi:autotransporter-associated beta strand protein